MVKKVFLTGTTGQDSRYLIEHLLDQDYEVHGMVRRSSTWNTSRIDHLMNDPKIFEKKFFTYYGDVTDANSVNDLVLKIKPDRIFNLSAQSHVFVSFQLPTYTAMVDALGPLYILEAARKIVPEARVYQASTSELCGGLDYNMPKEGYDEETNWNPRSPYSVSKLFAYHMTKNYRQGYNMYACNGILFNHSSAWRGENFLTRKVTIWCGKNYKKLMANEEVHPLCLGQLSSLRDEGHSYDYVRAMNLILDQEKPDDYVVATGECHSVKEWVETCFKWMNKTIEWSGSNENEIGICDGCVVVRVDPKYYRPLEVPLLRGNPSKIKKIGWKPIFTYEGIVDDMMKADIDRFSKD